MTDSDERIALVNTIIAVEDYLRVQRNTGNILITSDETGDVLLDIKAPTSDQLQILENVLEDYRHRLTVLDTQESTE